MSADEKEYKKFLEDQLDWCRRRELIFEEIEIRLHEMKKLAESVLVSNLKKSEIEQINLKINKINNEVLILKGKLDNIVN